MSKYYNSQRTSSIFNPLSKEPFRISRTKIDLFLNCNRCFYLDRKLGVAQPPGYPFSLNSAVDKLLKKEFDKHREERTPHPLMKEYGIDAIPFSHEKIEEWRDSLRKGIQYLDKETNLLITGGVDDVWQDKEGRIIIVDYKATAKNGEVSLDADWQIGYKRQMEIYQWLFRKNGFDVSDTGYFVYCNGDTEREFNNALYFDIKVIPYNGDDSWIDNTILEIHKCLLSTEIPLSGPDCDFCAYRKAVQKYER